MSVARPHVLYGSNGSGSAAVEIALEMTATPYEFVRASSWEPDSAIKQLRRLPPLGQIPTLVLPDGSVMTESAAILTHLGLAFIAAEGYPAVGVIDHPGRWCLDADTGTLARIHLAKTRPKFVTTLRRIEKQGVIANVMARRFT